MEETRPADPFDTVHDLDPDHLPPPLWRDRRIQLGIGAAALLVVVIVVAAVVGGGGSESAAASAGGATEPVAKEPEQEPVATPPPQTPDKQPDIVVDDPHPKKPDGNARRPDQPRPHKPPAEKPHVTPAEKPHVTPAEKPHVTPAEKPHVAAAEPIDAQALVDEAIRAMVKGDTHGALASLNKVRAAKPGYAPTWRVLGQIYEKQGDKAAAKNAYQRYLQLAPRAGDAATTRARLEKL